MTGYLITIILLVAYGCITYRLKGDQKKVFVVGVTIMMTVFYGFRNTTVGSDTISYIEMFLIDGSQSRSMIWKYMWQQKSPAYVLCEWIVYQIFPSAQIWLIITSCFFFAVLSRFIYINAEDPLYSYFLYFVIFGTFQMTGVRQSVAMAILMISYEKIKKRQLIQFLLLIYLAFLFHQSAAVFLPMYFLMKRKIHIYDIMIFVPLIILIYTYRVSVFNDIKSYTSYYYYEELNHGEPINFSLMIYSATVLGYILCILIRRSGQKDDQSDSKYLRNTKLSLLKSSSINQYNSYTNAMYCACVFMPMVAVNGSVRRIVMYFAMYMVLFIPKGLKEIFDCRTQQIAKIALGVFLSYIFLRGTVNSVYNYTLFI